jgi:hypothetical protein
LTSIAYPARAGTHAAWSISYCANTPRLTGIQQSRTAPPVLAAPATLAMQPALIREGGDAVMYDIAGAAMRASFLMTDCSDVS